MKRWAALGKVNNGFTIVELLIVIVVIGILAAITIVAFNGVQNRARQAAAQSAARQAYGAIEAYAVQNSGQYPATLAAANISNSGSDSYEYRVNNGVSPATFCITATSSTASAYVSNTQTAPTAGACPGHGSNGKAAITNLALNPRATSNQSGEWGNRYGTAVSFVSNASDGPLGISSYMRQTYNSASSGGGRGFDFLHNLDVNPIANTARTWPVVANQPITVSVYVRSSEVSTDRFLACNTHNGSGGWVNNGGAYQRGAVVSYTANSWTRVNLTYTPPGDGYLVCTMRFTQGTWPANSTQDATGLMVTNGSTLHNYADGTSSGWIWNGGANNSNSTGSPL